MAAQPVALNLVSLKLILRYEAPLGPHYNSPPLKKNACIMNPEYNKNEDVMKLSLSQLRQRLEQVALGGGKKAIEKQREKNKLTARERIEYLWDENTPLQR